MYSRWIYYVQQVNVLCAAGEYIMYNRWICYVQQVNILCTAGEYVLYSRWIYYVQQVNVLCTTGEYIMYIRWIYYVMQVNILCNAGEYIMYSRWICYVQQVNILCTAGECIMYSRFIYYVSCYGKIVKLSLFGNLKKTAQSMNINENSCTPWGTPCQKSWIIHLIRVFPTLRGDECDHFLTYFKLCFCILRKAPGHSC